MKGVIHLSLVRVQQLMKGNIITLKLMYCRAFADYSVSRPQLLVPYLNEGVEGLAIHLQELRLNVQHVDLRPRNHYSDEDSICGAHPLRRDKLGFTQLL